MKKIIIVLGVIGFLLQGCNNPYYDEMPIIELGKESLSTSIKSVFQSENVVIVEFNTTIGAKYSIQFIPFGSMTPITKEGFTATETITHKVYDLNKIPQGYYDMVFIDISGKEVKYPIIIN
jgi:hypothetical protein